jgi:lipopolysaccharide transport system permease protein
VERDVVRGIAQLYRSRALVAVLVQREVKARYRGAVLGLLWSFVNPLLLTVVYSIVFSIYLRIDMKNFPVFLLCGLLPWNCFVAGLIEGTAAIVSNGGIIKKVFLPAEVFPLVSVLSNAVHFLFSLPILIGAVWLFDGPLTWAWLALPAVLAVQIALTFGIVLLTSSLAAQYRDILHILPNVVMVLFFLSPIFYPNEMVPEQYRFLLTYNPLSYLVEAYHHICFEGLLPDTIGMSRVAFCTIVALGIGWWVFDRRREHFAEFV